MLVRHVTDGIIVEPLCLGIDAIRDHPVPLAGDVELRTVGQMPALEKIQSHQRVARLHQRPVHGQVGCRARQRLHVDVDVLGQDRAMSEKLRAPPLGQTLDKVDIVHPFVKAPVGVTTVERELPRHIP